MAFIYLKLDKGRDSTSKLAKFKQLIDGLIELGVDFTSREQLGFGAQYVFEVVETKHALISSGALCIN